jgi:membrane protein implicated in regulation of membrane protease activity
VGAATAVFLVLGGVGIVVLAVSLFFGELLHLGDMDVDGLFSVPAMAGFVGALGFAGAIGSSLAGGSGTTATAIGAGVGLAAALPVGWFAARFTRALQTMPTDRTLVASDLIGVSGVVVTPVPAGGYGEVRLAIAGQHLKYNAKADTALATGTAVFVVEAPTETSVVVVETTATH